MGLFNLGIATRRRKTAKLRIKTDMVSHHDFLEGLGKYIHKNKRWESTNHTTLNQWLINGKGMLLYLRMSFV